MQSDDLTKLSTFSKVLDVLFERWNLKILYALYLSPDIKFNELKTILGINSRTLSDRFKILQSAGFVVRSVAAGPPVKVSYGLTEKGKDVVAAVLPLVNMQI